MAKGGKGRKGGGGGAGPKQRKYERDNKGRFASTGSGGATARGGRLKTASGNKRKTQTITATGQKGVLAKPKGLKPGAIKPKAATKPATATPKAKSPKFTTEQSGRVRRAALGGGRTAIVRKNSAVIINAKGEPIMTRKGLPNITAGKKYAANPNARGPRLMGRDRSEASPSRGYIRTSAAQRNTKQARQRLAAKNAERRSQAAKKPTKKPKTELQTLQQADRLMGKLAKRQASIKVDKVGLDEGLRQIRRNNSRAGIVNRALDRRGLLGKYQKLNAGADAIHGTPAGKGIKQPTAKPAVRRKSVGSISEAKAGRIISRIDANRPGLRRASGSARKTANAIRTQQRATDFALAASARGRKQGKNLSVNQSLQRAIKNASAKAKPAGKPARFSASELAERKGYAKQLMAQPKGVRKANYLARKAQKTPDQLDKFKGRMKFGTQNTINNITEGRNYLTAKKSQFANTPEKRASIERSVTNSGRSLQARMKTTNLGTRLRRLNKPVTTKAAKTKGTIGKPKGLKPGNIKPKAAAKPARAARTPKTGQEVMKSEVRKVQNKKLRDLNAKIKSAGPNATSLRVEKLALKTRMIDTQPRQTAKQAAKSAKQDVAIRGRITEMRKQNARIARAQSNATKNADVRNSTAPMSKASFARRPSKKTMRSQLRADNALAFYANPVKALREVKKKPGFRKPRGMR